MHAKVNTSSISLRFIVQYVMDELIFANAHFSDPSPPVIRLYNNALVPKGLHSWGLILWRTGIIVGKIHVKNRMNYHDRFS